MIRQARNAIRDLRNRLNELEGRDAAERPARPRGAERAVPSNRFLSSGGKPAKERTGPGPGDLAARALLLADSRLTARVLPPLGS